MINEIAKKLANELRQTLDGATWYDANFSNIIEDIDADTAVKKLKGFPNSIVEIVCHMTQWKIFCIRKFEGNAAFDIVSNSEDDWKRFNSLSDEEWVDIKQNFENATIDLANAIAASPDEMMDRIVPGRKYAFFHLVTGITQHEAVHSTQIAYLKRMLES
jgi:hypothetical protein